MPEAVQRAVEKALAAALGRDHLSTRSWARVGGGCISEAARFETDAGSFFAKWNAQAPAGLFESEALCLREMAAAGSRLRVPKVFAVSEAGTTPAFIVMELLETRAARSADEELLGRGLADLHRHASDRFGFARDTYCGATRQANAWAESWPEFYASQRLSPLLAEIASARGLASSERTVFERVTLRLPELLPARANPGLIHGDLWSGNVLWTTSGPALVDPSCSYAEREMEFGITTLFGGLGPRAIAAYEEAYPLQAGWRERNPLYQLYHLLNHHLLFGGGYGASALRIARAFVS